MTEDPALLSAGAVALSSASILSSLITHLRHLGVINSASERSIYEEALMIVENSQGPEGSAVFQMAREFLEAHLRPRE